MGNYVIERFAPGKRPAKFWSLMGPMFASATVRRSLQTLHDSPDTDEWFVAVGSSKSPLAFACLRAAGESAELCHCWVQPDQRKNGLADRLTSERIKAAQEVGFQKLTTTATLESQPRLEKAGFVVPQQPKAKGKWNYVKMEKTL